jgi:low temperature requirement protein LtrA
VRGLEIPEREEDFAADPVELFFDLAYVFGFSQLVLLILDDHTWNGIGQATLLFLLMWLPWSQFTWSANAVSGNQRSIRVLFLAATAASVPMAASINTALDGGGLLFAIPLATIFLAALLMMVSGLEYGSVEYRSAVRYSIPSIVAMVLIVIGGLFEDELRVAIWIAGIAVFGAATVRAGSDAWIVRPGHFAERHGLIVIIALGEVIVALGNSVVVELNDSGSVPASTVVSLVAAGVLAGLLWWSYFDRVQPAFEHRAESLDGGVERGRFVRDIYTYAHIPVVAGIVLIAVALEEVTLHPTEPLSLTFRAIGGAGFVLFFGGLSAGVYRAFRVVAKERLAVLAAIVVLSAIGGSVDGILLFMAIDLIIFAALVVEQLRIERPNSPAVDHRSENDPVDDPVDDRQVEI